MFRKFVLSIFLLLMYNAFVTLDAQTSHPDSTQINNLSLKNNEEYFTFKIVKIDNRITECIDSIVSNNQLTKHNYYWYIDLTKEDNNGQIVLSYINVIDFVYYNNITNNGNFGFLHDGEFILLRIIIGDEEFLREISDNYVCIKNSKQDKVLSFTDNSYWVFSIDNSEIVFEGSVQWEPGNASKTRQSKPQ